jgi:beta-glucosidase-like glycosyl hydrolase
VAFELDTALKLPSVDCDAPGVDRFHFEGVVSDADLNDYYLPVFERPLSRARPAAIMCSFASVNGVP